LQEIESKNPAPTSSEKELLTVAEVLELLSISRMTFDKMLKSGTLKAYRLRRRIYCKRSEIMDALKPVTLTEI
jgi:excisionase family DNA binding protein